MTKCPECGGDMIREVRLVSYTYKNRTTKIEQPGEWCACGEGVLTPDDVKATEAVLYDLRESIDSIYCQ